MMFFAPPPVPSRVSRRSVPGDRSIVRLRRRDWRCSCAAAVLMVAVLMAAASVWGVPAALAQGPQPAVQGAGARDGARGAAAAASKSAEAKPADGKPAEGKPAGGPPAGAPPAPPPALVYVAPVLDREVQAAQTFVGSVKPLRRSSVGSAVDGRVVEFFVNEGDPVQARQPLAQLLTETINLQIASAEGELRLREAELEELKNGSLPEEIDQAQAQFESDEAALTYAKARYQRIKVLGEQGRVVTEDQIQESFSAFEQAQRAYDASKAALALVQKGPRAERIAQAQARVDLQTANVGMLRDQLKKHTMIAPFDGFVVAEHTEIGQWISRGELVAEIVELSEVDVEAFVLESQVVHLEPNEEVRVEVPALPGDVFTGRVTIIVPEGDVKSRTFPVKVRLENQFVAGVPKLKAGMLARVVLPVGPVTRGLFVPKDCIVLGGAKPIVYVAQPNPGEAPAGAPLTGVAMIAPVTLGVAHEGMIEIQGDLQPGQLVITHGNERLRPGQPITWQPAAVPPADHAATPEADANKAAASDSTVATGR